jgi:hypothetical protein
MDDYSLKNLMESKNELCSRLLNIFTPCLFSGINSLLDEAYNICIENNDYTKYLIIFQNLLSRIPKWNNTIIDNETKRIIETSSCQYIEDLVTCVHIIHLKALTAIRVGKKQKKIDLDLYSLNKFVHNVYINSARKLYTNVYLFEKDVSPLEKQKNNREIELIIKECILNTIRDSIPVKEILNQYLAETNEEDVEMTEELIDVPFNENTETDLKNNNCNLSIDKPIDKQIDNKVVLPIDNQVVLPNDNQVVLPIDNQVVLPIDNQVVLPNDNQVVLPIDNPLVLHNDNKVVLPVDNQDVEVDKQEVKNKFEKLNYQKPTFISFNNIDENVSVSGEINKIEAPKDIGTLDKKSNDAYEKRKLEEEEEEEYDDDDKIKIGGELSLESFDISHLNNNIELKPIELDIETL